MTEVNLLQAHGFAYGSGDQSQIIAAATAPTINFIHGWSLSCTGSATAMLFEYGTGSRPLDIVEGRGGATTAFGNTHSSRDLSQPYGVGSGSSIYLTVDGLANAVATVLYSTRD